MAKIHDMDSQITAEIVYRLIKPNETPKYLIGTNSFAKTAFHHLEKSNVTVKGFINPYTKQETFCHAPVIHSLSQVEKDAIVLICVVESIPTFVKKMMKDSDLCIVDYFSFIKYSGYPITIPYWETFYDSYQYRRDEYDAVYRMLADEESKKVFSDIMDFRLNYNLSAMSDYQTRIEEEYFEPFLHLKEEGEVFCDVGGFDGETSVEFIKRCPKYEMIHFFEPEPHYMESAKFNLIVYDKVKYYQCAASDKKGVLHFHSKGPGSKVADNGELEVHADRIDNMVKSPVTFLKMDVEGSETFAIDGAKETILKNHPRLAICVYHKGADLIDIPYHVFKIRNDYNIYLRHYSDGITETVMFFTPKSHNGE